MMRTMSHQRPPPLRSPGAQWSGFGKHQPDEAAALTLDGDGYIRDCNASVEAFFKYHRSELLGQKVSMLLPELGDFELMGNGQPNPRLHFLCRAGRRFQAVTKDGGRIPSALYLNLLDSAGKARLTLIVRQA